MRRKFKFTKKKAAKIKPGAVVEGPTIAPSRAIQDQVVRDLLNELGKMDKDVTKEVDQLFSSPLAKKTYAQDASFGSVADRMSKRITDKWLKIFNKFADNWADTMVDKFNDQAGQALGASLKALSGGLTIKSDSISKRTTDIMVSSAAEASSLIKSISSEYLSSVSEQVLRSVRDPAAGGLAELQKSIQANLSDKYKRTKNHAKNVALDQTRKVFNSLNASRMQDAGIESFVWIHSGGAKEPRKTHVAMNGNVYRFDDLPVIDERTGERGLPGQAYYCRCMMKPVIDFGDDDDDE